MSIYDTLANVELFIVSRRQAAVSKGRREEASLWSYVRAFSDFVRVTGQVYRFEDSLEGAASTERPLVSARLSEQAGTFAQPAVKMLLETLGETAELEQKQHVCMLIALLNFIAETGQLDEVEDLFSNLRDYAPVAIAHFNSHQEAETWLMGIAEPPSPTHILVGDEYYQFWYMREDNTRGMYRDYSIEPALEALTARGIPPQVPSFATRAEAEGWLMSHPANPYAFVTIGGEYYFAVHHRRLKRHSLNPVASALNAWEEHKRAVELETALEAAAQSSGPGE
ncbi:hypothetical protein [Archangium sp.]|uniref:hypothetical protein n=1 Tax=Archangium sp. TaxID=1872627 RepID=UPI00286D487D|nr:hypothetical protein [Archangium sp.]